MTDQTEVSMFANAAIGGARRRLISASTKFDDLFVQYMDAERTGQVQYFDLENLRYADSRLRRLGV